MASAESSEVDVRAASGRLVKHRLFIGTQHCMLGAHVAEMLREVYHEVVLVTANGMPTSRSASPAETPGRTPTRTPTRTPRVSAAGAAAAPAAPNASVQTLRHQSMSSLLPLPMAPVEVPLSTSWRSERSCSPLQVMRRPSLQLSAARTFGGVLDCASDGLLKAPLQAWLRASGRNSCEEDKKRQDVVRLLERALQQARATQLRVAVPLACTGTALLVAALLVAAADLAWPRGPGLTSCHAPALHVHGSVFACSLMLTLLALLPYPSFAPLVRALCLLVIALKLAIVCAMTAGVHAIAVRELGSSAACVSATAAGASGTPDATLPTCDTGRPDASLAVCALWATCALAGGGFLARARAHALAAWSRPSELLNVLWTESGCAIGGCATLQAGALLRRWLAPSAAGSCASAWPCLEAGMSGATAFLACLVLWPGFRQRAHRVLSRALVKEGSSSPVAPLIGFARHDCDATRIFEAADAAFRAVVLDDAALDALRADDSWGAAGGERARARLRWAQSGAGSDATAECATVDCYVCHSTHDGGRERLDALRAWVRQETARRGTAPTAFIDALCDDRTADDSLGAGGHLERMPVFLAKCRTLVVLCGPTFTDRLWCCVELYTWRAMGGRLEDVEIVLVGQSEQQYRETVASFDAFHVMYAQASRAHDEERLVRAVELASVSCFNSTVRGYMPLVLGAVQNALKRASDEPPSDPFEHSREPSCASDESAAPTVESDDGKEAAPAARRRMSAKAISVSRATARAGTPPQLCARVLSGPAGLHCRAPLPSVRGSQED
ncbi:hypothetical protein KFE25_009413 [Diacronema lutheri]|uniref:TIR domain-containing protein n=1 Tax=Diacronema lutheri TaxID=2081491 RepID=A0A8J6CDG8_DIALT|nr:hypothetical protein KFE25_009413 [Diacronema lutheri]